MVSKTQTDGSISNGHSISPIVEKRQSAIQLQEEKMKICNNSYTELVTELFFLQHGGNYTEFSQFKKRPSQKLIDHLRQTPVFPNGDGRHRSTDSRKSSVDNDNKSLVGQQVEVEPKIAQISIETTPVSSLSGNRPISSPRNFAHKTNVSTPPRLHLPLSLPSNRLKLPTRNTLSDVYEDTIGSQEEILERAKQEAVIQRRVADLRKQGLWSQRRLPKVQEPPRNKTHWDYLLEEMRWLAADFAQERKWKRAAARKVVRMVNAYHRDVREKEKRVEREGQQKLRRIASNMARQIRNFWSNIEKVVEYKQRSLLDEKRQKALDMHLNFIVDQTAKYSDWLSQGLNKPTDDSPAESKPSSHCGSDDDFLPQGASSDDEETIAIEEEHLQEEHVQDELALLQKESEIPFEDLLSQLPPDVVQNIGVPVPDSTPVEEKQAVQDEDASQNEEVIQLAEVGEENIVRVKKEADSDSAIEESISSGDDSSKPHPISLRRSARKRQGEQDEDEDEHGKRRKTDNKQDEEFDVEAESSSDDEQTMQEQEQSEEVDHEKEIADLQAENDLPIEELMKMYAGYDSTSTAVDAEEPTSDSAPQEVEKSEKEESDSEASDEEASAEEEEQNEEIGMDYLLKADLNTKDEKKEVVDAGADGDAKVESSPNKEITDVAAEAMSLQPTGHTLATTQVVTPVPVLLKHTLREYQHIGLDWLVTMYDKRLNGILADEMGLGKTIQTIALLAHLACDKGVWGPHLIVVPTSVMLNWEMEFKKWCPGFKILTYYGSQKERKLKRTGWTKSNAFHVCITSYKLVLQDHTSFRRKKWRYLILDEAQNIKNFKSQRWQTLLNFNSQRRLLLTGTPLQNNLMELWSLMHFLMPHVFQSHREFKEWFSNPMTGMIEGSQEFNEKIIRRLHKVLRPFLLRRIKKDVEKQMPNKYEHVVRCHLSKRQRFLYEDFMSRTSTKETLAGGHFMSVINVLMQLRKVCNHPNLFESRPTVSAFVTSAMSVSCPTLVIKAMEKSVFEEVDLQHLNLHLPSLCKDASYTVERRHSLITPKTLIEEIDTRKDIKTEAPSHPANLNDRIRLMVFERLFTSTNPLQQQKNASLLANRPASRSESPTPQHKVISTPTGTPVTAKSSLIQVKTDSTDSNTSRTTSSSQSITLQYQTAQGTRWATIPNGQIRHLPGGVVQIVTSGVPPRSATPVSSQNTLPPSDATTEAEVNVAELSSSSKRLPAESYTKMLCRMTASKRAATLSRIHRINQQRCNSSQPYLPRNTIDLLTSITQPRYESSCSIPHYFWRDRYPTPDELSSSHQKQKQLLHSSLLHDLVKFPSTRLKNMEGILNRFTFVVPKVTSSSTKFISAHQTPWKYYSITTSLAKVRRWMSEKLIPYHRILRNTRVQFPEVRLIEYDCGKLQVLNVLLRRFWVEKHRILIFTQMTRVLDILEAFLSYHGYRYLRLDGSTPIEQRMARMERFNNDPRIFCFILSTRSGGIGVNLTGADTVVFYDSDWNPTMDAQAQDRCHRIGQTRDVHIYRLISERTVEENILKKANQKRLLGEMAIEGGSFTTAFFKEQALQDLFSAPSGLEELTEQTAPARPLTARQKAIEASKSEPTTNANEEENLEVALLETEDKEDAAAAKMLKEEQDAVLEEFTEETEKTEEDDGISERFKIPKGSKVEEELKTIYDELNPIERYALRFLELSAEELNDLELQEAENQVEKSKKDWELSHLVALKEEEEMRMEEEDEIFYTREDAEAQVRKSGKRRKKERDICFMDMSTSEEEGEEFEDEQENVNVWNEGEQIAKPKKVRAKPKPKKERRKGVAKGRGRGRGKMQAGVTRLESASKRARFNDVASDISDTEFVNGVINHEGDPLWTEYGQETAGYLLDDNSDDLGDFERWGFSSESEPPAQSDDEDQEEDPGARLNIPNQLSQNTFRESPLWKVAEKSEKLLQNTDYGPCEILSFSKSGRPRKRNIRLCEDEFEVFSPVSDHSDSNRKPPNPSPVYNVLIETPDQKQKSTKYIKKSILPDIKLKPKQPHVATKPRPMPPAANFRKQTFNMFEVSQPQRTVTHNTIAGNRGTVILPFSFVQSSSPTISMTPVHAKLASLHGAKPSQPAMNQTVNIRISQPQSTTQTVYIQPGQILPQQIKIVSSVASPFNPAVLSVNNSNRGSFPNQSRGRGRGKKLTPKQRESVFDLDLSAVNTNAQSKDKSSVNLFESLQDELNCDLSVLGGDEEDMITLDLEPVDVPTDQFLAPENEEERNVFESFESLLQS